MRLRVILAAVLVAMTIGVFWQILDHDFVDYDDPAFVTRNAYTQAGPTRATLHWALTTTHTGNWHPLTWLSHMIDCRLYGLDPTGHHLTSLLIHLLSVVLLFLILSDLTGSVWRSAFVAGLFALHPLHVESVAWVAERKDVLSGLFFMLTIWSYVRYVRKPSANWRLMTAGAMLCGLMAKPMLVSLPLVLLLLDYWPLKRYREDEQFGRRFKELALDKAPLFLLIAAISLLTIRGQSAVGALGDVRSYPLWIRMQNVLVSYVTYIFKTLWPTKLCCYYPYPEHGFPAWKLAICGLVMISVTVLAFRCRRHRPYLAVGWLWYIVSMVPVIGIVQVGTQAMADRYTYLPIIGLFIMVAWGIPDLIEGVKTAKTAVLSSGAVLVLAALAISAHTQAYYWQDTITLFQRAVEAVPNNPRARVNVGDKLYQDGNYEAAIRQFNAALRIDPDMAIAHYDIALCLKELGSTSQAIHHLRRACALSPHSVVMMDELGSQLLSAGKVGEANEVLRGAKRFRSKPLPSVPQ